MTGQTSSLWKGRREQPGAAAGNAFIGALASVLLQGPRSMVILGGDGAGKTQLMNQILERLPAGTRCAVLHDRVRDITRHPHLDWIEDVEAADVAVCGDMVDDDARRIHELSLSGRTIFALPSMPEREYAIEVIRTRTGVERDEIESTYDFVGIDRDPRDGRRQVMPDQALAERIGPLMDQARKDGPNPAMATARRLAFEAGALLAMLIVLGWITLVASLAWMVAWPPEWPGHDREVKAMSHAALGALPAVIIVTIALIGATLLMRAVMSRTQL